MVFRGMSERAARGAAFIVAGRFVMRVLGLVNTIILARLLAPADFGLVAVGFMAMQLLQGFSNIGLPQAVIRFRDAGRAELDTLFTLAIIRGAAVAFILVIAAPIAARFYGDARIAVVFCALAVFPIVQGFGNPRFFEFERELDFSKEFAATALTKLAGVAASITIAVLFRTYLAIIAGFLVGALLQLVLSYALRPHLPRLTLRSLRKVLGFSGWITGVSFIAALNNKLDAFVLARVIGAADTGAYYVGFQLTELPTTELAEPMSRAIYPGLSALQGDRERMRLAFLRGVAALGAVAMPAAFGFAFVAGDLLPLLLGQKWAPAIPVVQWLAPVLALQTILVATQFYAMAQGLMRLIFIRELIFFAIRFPIFVWAALAYGLHGAILATAGCGLVHIALNLGVYARASGAPFWEPFWSARRSFAGVGAMALVLTALPLAVPALCDAPGLFRLATEIALGGGVYIAAQLALWRAEGRPEGVEAFALGLLQRSVASLKRA